MPNEPKPSDINSELTDAQLEQAAGGCRIKVRQNARNIKLCARYNISLRFVHFPTVEAAKDYIATLESYGMDYDIYN